MSDAKSTPMLLEGLDQESSLTVDVLSHLDVQLASARRLLGIVLEQGVAIRTRDVHTVVALAGLLHGELARRQPIELERASLLERAGAMLGIAPELVTLTSMGALMDPVDAELAAARSSELRGLLDELRREHSCNRAIMQIELSFLDHLMKSLALDGGVHCYDPHGSAGSKSQVAQRGALHILDLQA